MEADVELRLTYNSKYKIGDEIIINKPNAYLTKVKTYPGQSHVLMYNEGLKCIYTVVTIENTSTKKYSLKSSKVFGTIYLKD